MEMKFWLSGEYKKQRITKKTYSKYRHMRAQRIKTYVLVMIPQKNILVRTNAGTNLQIKNKKPCEPTHHPRIIFPYRIRRAHTGLQPHIVRRRRRREVVQLPSARQKVVVWVLRVAVRGKNNRLEMWSRER